MSGARFIALRLTPGDDLRAALTAAFDAEPEQAGFVAAAVGSLTVAMLRMAGQDGTTAFPGPLEIVALSGTFSTDGPHLHLAVSDATGRMTGGHLLPGSVVRTTAEVVIGLLPGLTFDRPQDPVTGYRELRVRPRL
ncbi:MAG: DUF296 domain-containing protein [Rhodobacteraceae bacterium]|nr:DUF296 domain-containing protein [Paracoccaceae bacterium]